jgi:hypothetical protein
MTIELTGDVNHYFERIVSESIASQRVQSSAAAEYYLVELLSGFAKPGAAADASLDAPLTFLLHDALEQRGAERFERLRRIGDGVLYLLGFFGGSFTKRGADRGYVLRVGSSAYSHAAVMLRRSGGGDAPAVLSELADKFEGFVAVLGDVADSVIAAGSQSDRAMLAIYERWLVTGSRRLQQRLTACGMVPARGTEAMN